MLESGPSELRPLMLSWLWLPERSRTDGKKARVRAVRSAPGFDNRSALAVWKKEADGGDGAHPPEDTVAAAAHGEELTRHGLGEGRGQVGRLTELAPLDEEAAPQTTAMPASVRGPRSSDSQRRPRQLVQQTKSSERQETESKHRSCCSDDKEESAGQRCGIAPAVAIVEAPTAQAHIPWREGRARRHGDAELVDAAREAGGRVGEGWLVAADGAVEDETELAAAQLQGRRPPVQRPSRVRAGFG